MFAGIIQAKGKLVRVVEQSIELQVLPVADHWKALKNEKDPFEIGESIAVNGACLTVVKIQGNEEDGFMLKFDLAPETLNRTIFGDQGKVSVQLGEVFNLERSLRMGERISGHMVSGHVDGLGIIQDLKKIKGECYEMIVDVPPELAKYCVKKGSIAVNGISLTIHEVQLNSLIFQLIPHTWSATSFSDQYGERFELCRGKKVNLEVDMMAKQVEQLIGQLIEQFIQK